MAGKRSVCLSAGWKNWAKEEEEASISGPGEACRPFVLELFTPGRAPVKRRWRESSVLSRFVQGERPRSSEEMASNDWVGRGLRAKGARVLGAEEKGRCLLRDGARRSPLACSLHRTEHRLQPSSSDAFSKSK